MAKNNIADAALESSEQSVSAVPDLSEETNATASDTVDSDLHSPEDSQNDVASASFASKETIPESGIRDMLEITVVGDTRKVVEYVEFIDSSDESSSDNDICDAEFLSAAEKNESEKTSQKESKNECRYEFRPRGSSGNSRMKRF